MTALASIVADPIEVFLPGCAGEERHLRERLVKAREYATARIRHEGDEHALALRWMIVDTATTWMYASAPIDELRAAANQCVRLAMCANFFEGRANGQ